MSETPVALFAFMERVVNLIRTDAQLSAAITAARPTDTDNVRGSRIRKHGAIEVTLRFDEAALVGGQPDTTPEQVLTVNASGRARLALVEEVRQLRVVAEAAQEQAAKHGCACTLEEALAALAPVRHAEVPA